MKYEIYECAFLMPLPTAVADFFDFATAFVVTAVVVSCILYREMKIALQKYVNFLSISSFNFQLF